MILAHHLPRSGVPEAPAPPLLLIHGAWHGAWSWENFVPWFSDRGHEVYTIELRGHGHHPGAPGHGRGPGASRLSHYVDDVARAVERIGTPPALVGHSMGGFVIQKYLEDHMAPVGVLLASAPPGGALTATVRGLVRHAGSIPRVLRRLSLAALLERPETMRELMFSDDTPQATVDAACRRLGEESLPAFLDMHGLDLPDTRRVLSPVVVVGAEEDGIFSRSDVVATARAYGTEPIWVPGGHDMMLDVAWEDAAEVVRRAVLEAAHGQPHRPGRMLGGEAEAGEAEAAEAASGAGARDPGAEPEPDEPAPAATIPS